MDKKLFSKLHVLTFDKNFQELKDAAIYIEDDTIKDIGLSSKLIKKYQSATQIDCSGKIAMPGLINSHTHLAMSFLKGLGHAGSEIIYSVMFPAEKNLQKGDLNLLSQAGALEAIKYGVTTVAEHYYFANEIAEAMAKTGLRAFIGHTCMDLMGPHVGDKEFKAAKSFIEKWKNHPLISPVVAPHAPDTVSKEKLIELLQLAEDFDLPIHLHVAQTKLEVENIYKTTKLSPVGYLNSLNFLSDRVMAAHLIHVNDQDINTLKEKNVHYLCCATSQIFFEHLAPLDKLWKAGLNFCPGTDSVTSHDSVNLFHECHILKLFLSDRLKTPLSITARNMLAMCTRNAARALRADDKIGSLEINKKADFLILDLRQLATSPVHDVYNSILYSFSEKIIDKVIIAGKTLVDNNKLFNVDEIEISKKLSEKSFDILNRNKPA